MAPENSVNKTFNNVQQKSDRLILILKQKIFYITIYLHLHTEEVKCLSDYFTVLSNKMYKNKQKYRECRSEALMATSERAWTWSVNPESRGAGSPMDQRSLRKPKTQLQFLPTLAWY
jgi:hypothetical protein